ncbi:MAG: hypothetical protein ACFFEY_02015 [Candidatus Thorarchaeota archaeon]
MTSIFQIDWIFVDFIIIILLLLLLVSVRIFKTTHRWRKSFSNEALEEINMLKKHEDVQNKYFMTVKCSLTKNTSISKDSQNLPLVLVVSAYYKRKLLRILTEGLATYGFNVISLKVKKKNNIDAIPIDKKIEDAWNSYMTMLIDYIKINEQKINANYILINQSKPPVPYKVMISESNNKSTILINPKPIIPISKNVEEIIKEFSLNLQLFTIFSGKSIFYLKNKRLNKWLEVHTNKNTNEFNFLPIYKAKYSFKYYETVVLGLIIDIITNVLPKSEI